MILTRQQSAALGIGSVCLFLLTAVLEWRSHRAEALQIAALRSELHDAQSRLSALVSPSGSGLHKVYPLPD